MGPGAERVPFPGPAAARLRAGAAHAVRGCGAVPEPAGRTPPPGPGERHAPGAPGRPARLHDQRRGHPRHRGLRRGGVAHRDLRGQGQRGLRHREPGRRHLPAGQHLVANPAGGLGQGVGGGRPRGAAHPAVLVGRVAGAQPGALPGGVRGAGERGPARLGRRRGLPLAAGRDRGGPGRRRSGRRLRGRDPGGARVRAVGGPGGGRALLRRVRRHAARAAHALREPHQPGVGAGPAQAVLRQLRFRAASRGHGRRHRDLPDRPPLLPPGHGLLLPAPGNGGAGPDPGGPGHSHVHQPLALEREPGAGGGTVQPGQEGPHDDPAHACGGPPGGGVPGPSDVPGQPRRTREPAGPSPDQGDHGELPARGHGRGRPQGDPRPPGAGEDRDRSGGDPGALAHGPRDPQRQPLRLPRRCAAGGTARPGGGAAADGPGPGPGHRRLESRSLGRGEAAGVAGHPRRGRTPRPPARRHPPAGAGGRSMATVRRGTHGGGAGRGGAAGGRERWRVLPGNAAAYIGERGGPASRRGPRRVPLRQGALLPVDAPWGATRG